MDLLDPHGKPIGKNGPAEQEQQYATNWIVQLAVLCSRNFKNLVRNPTLLRVHIIAAILIAIFLGLAFYNTKDGNVSGVQNRTGAMFFLIALFSFISISSLESCTTTELCHLGPILPLCLLSYLGASCICSGERQCLLSSFSLLHI